MTKLKETYDELKVKYAFNPGDIKDRFLYVADNIFYSNNAYMKQYNLLMFRMHNQNLPLPELFFSYSFDDSQNMDTDGLLSDYVKSLYKSEDENYISKFSISKVLQDGFIFATPALKLKHSPKIQSFSIRESKIVDDKEIVQAPEIQIPFVIDYFCTSTFPAVFAHFISNEYLIAGQNFIKRHINDRIAPRLVGTYLLHNNLFKDRLFSAFFKKIIQFLLDKTEPEENFDMDDANEFPDDHEEELERIFKNKKYFSNQNLLTYLYESFKLCMEYFNEYQVNVVKMLCEKDKQAAIIAITNYFLHEVISLWKYSPIYNYTSIFNKIQTLKNPEFFQEIVIHNILDDLARIICSNKAFALKILSLFDDDSIGYTEVPDISSMKYFNGVSFCVTMADMKIIQCIILAEKRELMIFNQKSGHSKSLNVSKKYEFTPITNVRDFIAQMFLLRILYKQYISPPFNEPKSKVLSTELSKEKLLENQTFLNFFIDRMKGMKLLQMCMDSALSILQLKERQYAEQLWNSNKKCNSNYFSHKMYVQFCWSIFTGQVNYSKSHIEILNKSEKDFYSYFDNSIENNSFVASKNTLSKYLFDRISNYYRMLRANSDDPLNGEVYFNENLINYSQYLFSEIERISFELLMNMMNEYPYQFIETSTPTHSNKPLDTYRKEKFDAFLKNNTISVTVDPQDESLYDLVIQSADLIRTIVLLADIEMEKEVNQWITEKFRIGDKLLLFLMLKKMIKNSLEKTDFRDLPQYCPCILRNGDYDYDYLRANLINCINVFTNVFSNTKCCFLSMNTEIIDSLNYLRTAFDIKENKK